MKLLQKVRHHFYETQCIVINNSLRITRLIDRFKSLASTT